MAFAQHKSRHFGHLLLVSFLLLTIIDPSLSLCEIETKENVAILEITESLGNQTNQSTVPTELPIKGTPTEISLAIQSETRSYFDIRGKSLALNKPLDRDKDKISSIFMQISCIELRTGVKRNVPVLIKVIDINDNVPQFGSHDYHATISELAPKGTVVFKNITAIDYDSGPNGLVEYYTKPLDGSKQDGYDYFEIKMPHQGVVTLKKPIDFERSSIYYLQITAINNVSHGQPILSSSTILTVNVMDGDDLDPAFVYPDCPTLNGACIPPEYKSAVSSETQSGVLKIFPAPIEARDQDTMNATIVYSFAEGTPTFYDEIFDIDSFTGIVKQLKPVDRSKTKVFRIKIKAEQRNNRNRFVMATLTIAVLAVDRSPPVIVPSAFHGYVQENAPIGSVVYEDKFRKNPLRLMVTDKDIASDDTPAVYTFEVTTEAFAVNGDGYLIVKDPLLDRDSPNQSTHKFQVLARQVGAHGGKGTSVPVTITVHLTDINDNSPKFLPLEPVHIQAGEGSRLITKVNAKDPDEVDAGNIVYSIFHVSNNGKEKFRINSLTGEITAVGKLYANQQYSITVQAKDLANNVAQTILDVFVVPGPNRGGPMFLKERYEVEVSEGISVSSPIVSLNANDPENDPIRYSFTEGNVNEDFSIGKETGVIRVAKPLNREEVSTYHLVVKAEDKGGLFSTATVLVSVTDINDENPKFLQNEYRFKVEEEIANAFVGKVTARDADIGENGEVIYTIADTNNFQIDNKSGEIFTNRALDYERQTNFSFVVTAQDKAPDARLSTATVLVEVLDVQDELPYFEKASYEIMVPENVANRQITQVRAIDPDSVPSLTYVIREGDTSLFSIDQLTGILKTTRGLDYEKRGSYSLVIGTMENNSNEPSATTVVNIRVQDQNDNPPVFKEMQAPVKLQDSVPLGTVVTTVKATDADGTPPGNQVRYELVGEDKATSFFLVDANNGVITVKDDLRKEFNSEYKLTIKARDLGIPSLSATTTVTVFVEHIAKAVPNAGIGFADGKYTIEVEENVAPNTLVKVLPVINKPRGHFPMSCEIISGNEAKRFFIKENQQKDCEIRVQDKNLDYEKQSKYFLTVHLNTIGGLTGISRLITQLIVNIIDVNDNKPKFVIPERYSEMTGSRYVAAIAKDAPSDSQVIQVKATDADSSINAAITYELTPASDTQYFKIDPSTGILRNNKPTEDILENTLPLTVTVVARDRPQLETSSFSESVQVAINLIEDKHRIILVFESGSTSRIQELKDVILRIFQERTGMIAGWEKAESLKIQRNHSIESDVSGTDVWLYLIEPGTLKILSTDDSRVLKRVFDTKARHALLVLLRQTVGYQDVRIRRPYVPVAHQPKIVSPVIVTADVYDFGVALIILAAVIALFGIVGIIHQCCVQKRPSGSSLGSINKSILAPSSRLYDPVYVEPSFKQYETQILQMSVPVDDELSSQEQRAKNSLKGLISSKNMLQNVTFISDNRLRSDGTQNKSSEGKQSRSQSSSSNEDSNFSVKAALCSDKRNVSRKANDHSKSNTRNTKRRDQNMFMEAAKTTEL